MFECVRQQLVGSIVVLRMHANIAPLFKSELSTKKQNISLSEPFPDNRGAKLAAHTSLA